MHSRVACGTQSQAGLLNPANTSRVELKSLRMCRSAAPRFTGFITCEFEHISKKRLKFKRNCNIDNNRNWITKMTRQQLRNQVVSSPSHAIESYSLTWKWIRRLQKLQLNGPIVSQSRTHISKHRRGRGGSGIWGREVRGLNSISYIKHTLSTKFDLQKYHTIFRCGVWPIYNRLLLPCFAPPWHNDSEKNMNADRATTT